VSFSSLHWPSSSADVVRLRHLAGTGEVNVFRAIDSLSISVSGNISSLSFARGGTGVQLFCDPSFFTGDLDSLPICLTKKSGVSRRIGNGARFTAPRKLAARVISPIQISRPT
jgi:hypothetical protein